MSQNVTNEERRNENTVETEEGDWNSQSNTSSMELRVSEFESPVFSERTTITVQPRPEARSEFRRPVPVATVDDWHVTNLTNVVPLSAMEYFEGADQVYIQQTVELTDLTAYIESENRYLVKIPRGDSLFIAAESSSASQRQLCGSYRAFQMNLFDKNSRQLVFYMSRKMRCSSCLFGCCLQNIEVYSSSNGLIGWVEQEWTYTTPTLLVREPHKNIIYRIMGPQMWSCATYSHVEFKVFSGDGYIPYGSILHHWDEDIVSYTVTITFPSRDTPINKKALLLAAGFLLEYMYFEKSKRAGRCKCL